MAAVSEIYTLLAELAPPELAEGWDNVGLLVDCGGEVSRLLVALDITPEVVDEAAALDCQLIVSHHPVIFHALKKLGPQDVPFQLIQAGISAICMHTNLDAAAGGVNDVLAGLFGMQSPEAFADGCGRVGAVSEISVPALAEKCRTVLGAHVKLTDSGRPVHRLAVISGAGGGMFADALAVGADCLLTGEASHHDACDAARLGLSLIAAGHYATEFPVVPALAAHLQGRLPQVEALCSRQNRDPFTYL